MTVLERLTAKVEKHDETCDCCAGCWHWTAARSFQGYGKFWHRGSMRGAHRVAYELLVGPIPENLTIDHLCSRRHCVNPAHMEPVTLAVNSLRGDSPWARNARKKSCVHGHAYTVANTIKRRDGRECRACKIARNGRRSSGGAVAA